jgi:molybdenum cofactor biosynthesis protein B
VSLEVHHARAPRALTVQIVTLSDTRDPSSDTSGGGIRAAVESAGHTVRGPWIVREDPVTLATELRALLSEPGVDAVIINGGTGIAPRDLAFDILSRLYSRPMPGFGELFRALSFVEIGAAAMLSRASAGVVGDRVVFSIPGSPAAVRLALERLILPELAHCVGELRRGHVPEGRR